MRHNPASGAVIIMLRSLKMHGMAQAVAELTEQGSPAFEAALPILSQLLKAETADREVRSTAYQLKSARFPTYRDLTGFDFASSEVNEALVRQLHRCEFLEDAHNIVLVGGPGTGKTHIATALGVQAIEHHRKRVRFFSTIELVNALEQEKLQGKAGQIAARLCHSDLVILDELGYLLFSASGGVLLFDPVEQALRAQQPRHHDQSELWRMGKRLRRRQDDHGPPRSAYPSMPHRRDRERQLPLQNQFSQTTKDRKGESPKLDDNLTQNTSSRRVTSRWKSRVNSQWKSTARREAARRGCPDGRRRAPPDAPAASAAPSAGRGRTCPAAPPATAR